tara:strand:+ start:1034 stop:1351 length:318 start_codon:yes stop_codon:yes gene_type:complete
MKQMSLFKREKPARGGIDQQELALVRNEVGEKVGYVHGTYEEVEYWCEENGYWVDRYLDNIAPNVVQSGFKYVGSGANPFAVARPIYKKDDDNNFIGYTSFKEKF